MGGYFLFGNKEGGGFPRRGGGVVHTPGLGECRARGGRLIFFLFGAKMSTKKKIRKEKQPKDKVGYSWDIRIPDVGISYPGQKLDASGIFLLF